MQTAGQCARFMCIMCVVMLSVVPAARGQDAGLEPVGDFGAIDWVGRKVVARGLGVAPGRVTNPGRARILAQRASLVVARRNLLEVIQGIHIDSATRVENFLTRNDRIVSRVKGELKGSNVEGVEYLPDGTVLTTVSLALTGPLGQILMQLAAPAAAVRPPDGDLERRLRLLEDRVRTLEQRLMHLGEASARQHQMIALWIQYADALWEAASRYPLLLQAGYDRPRDFRDLDRKLSDQQVQLKALAARLDQMAARLAVFEGDVVRKPQKTADQVAAAYTGLVIDARGTGFRPCLKPKLYSRAKLIYPGIYVDQRAAIRGGYVRYYNKLDRAQQSKRVGALPLTVKAEATHGGLRNLELGDDEGLMGVIGGRAEFLRQCGVAIVF